MHGSGTTNPSRLFWRVTELLEAEVRVPIKLTYRAVGSSTGQAEYVADVNHFGSGDIPLTAAQYASMTTSEGAGHTIQLPIMIGEVGFFHNVPGMASGELKMTGCTLAGIFQGNITSWDDDAIVELNPSMATVGQGKNISVVHRLLGSSSTAASTEYMQTKCPSGWQLSTGSSITWPATSNFHSAEGSDGVTRFLQDNEFSIGYLDSGHGHSASLAEVSVQNLDGTFLTSGGAGGVGSAAMAADAALQSGTFPTSGNAVDFTADWSSVHIYDQAGNVTWPISLITYIYVRTNSTAMAESGPVLRVFLEYLLSDRGQGLVEEFGFSPLPVSLRDAVRDAINSTLVTDPTQTAFVFEESTAPVTGMGVNVVSFKRVDYAVLDRKDLATDILTLTAAVDAGLSPAVVEVTAAPAAEVDTYTSLQDLDPFLAFSVALSVINAIVVIVLCAMVCCKSNKSRAEGVQYRL